MKNLRWYIPVGALIALTISCWSATAATKRQPTGRDAFLRYRVQTVEELVAQIQADPVVRARLAKHFHVGQAELVAYLRDNLVVQTVPESGYYTVYGVTEKTGRIYPTRQYFRKNQKVFALRDGSPLLKWECGNPIATRLPKVAPPPPPPLQPAPPPSAMGPGPVEEAPAAEAMETTLPGPEVTPVTSLPPSPVEERVAAAPRERTNVLPILVGSGAALLLTVNEDHGCQPVVPEPATIALIAFGLLVLALIVWWQRRAAIGQGLR
jgi:hypothetical protein